MGPFSAPMFSSMYKWCLVLCMGAKNIFLQVANISSVKIPGNENFEIIGIGILKSVYYLEWKNGLILLPGNLQNYWYILFPGFYLYYPAENFQVMK